MLNIIISFISGILLSLAFSGANLHWLAWFALAPIMYYIYRLSWKQSLLSGLAFGIGFFACLIYWVAIFGKLPWIVLSIYEALFIVVFVGIAKLTGSKLSGWGRFILLPALWVALEWVRTLGFLGLAWGDLCYTQYKVPPVIQIAGITGAWGISFILAMSNSALANLAAARKDARELKSAHLQVLVTGLTILAVVLFGLVSLRNPITQDGHKIRAAVIQGNVKQDTDEYVEYMENTWRTYHIMTEDAGKKNADLIIWPETVVPGCVGRDKYAQNRLSDLAASVGAHLLVGGWDEINGKALNSAFLIGPNRGVLGRYSKVHLVPFGELVPMRKYLPFLQYYRARPTDTSPGPGYNVINSGLCTIGTGICFESTFPYISRKLTASGAELLCIITDDEWFGRTSAAEQHMSKSVLRAVENRRYLLRGAATGISCIIDPRGRILAEAGLFRPAILRADVQTISQKTFYTRHGDWLIYASLVLVFLMAIVNTYRKGRAK